MIRCHSVLFVAACAAVSFSGCEESRVRPPLRFYSSSPVKSTPYFALGDRFDALIATGLEATDRTEVQRLSAEAMRAIVDEEVVAIPLAGLGRIYALSDEVSGFRFAVPRSFDPACDGAPQRGVVKLLP